MRRCNNKMMIIRKCPVSQCVCQVYIKVKRRILMSEVWRERTLPKSRKLQRRSFIKRKDKLKKVKSSRYKISSAFIFR